MSTSCGKESKTTLRFGSIKIDIITLRNSYYAGHSKNEKAIIMRCPGGRCVWIKGGCIGYGKYDERYRTKWIVNNTSWENNEFVAFCTVLVSKILPQHEIVFQRCYMNMAEYKLYSIPHRIITLSYPMRDIKLERVLERFSNIANHILEIIISWCPKTQIQELALINSHGASFAKVFLTSDDMIDNTCSICYRIYYNYKFCHDCFRCTWFELLRITKIEHILEMKDYTINNKLVALFKYGDKYIHNVPRIVKSEFVLEVSQYDHPEFGVYDQRVIDFRINDKFWDYIIRKFGDKC
jgi:hypothetical protein